MKTRRLTRPAAKTNLRYNRGADFERKVKKYFQGRDFEISRAAGSHGIFDLQGHDGTAVWDIQCKLGYSKASAEKLADELQEMLLERYAVLTIPVVVAVMYDWKNGQPVGAQRVLVPSAEKIDAKAAEISKPHES